MASTCRQVVKAALRKLGVADPRKEPTAQQAEDALDSLISLYQEWITNGAFGRLADVTTSEDMTARPGTRIVKTLSTLVVTLPRVGVEPYNEPEGNCDCKWDYGFIRCNPYLLDMSAITISALDSATVEQWVYDALTNQWISIENLTLDSPAPLSSRGADGLAAVLASRIADEYGDAATLSQATVLAATKFTTSILTRPASYRPSAGVYGDYM